MTGFTQADYDSIVNIARTVYGIDDLGGTPVSDPSVDEKYLARVDWNINDRHRAAIVPGDVVADPDRHQLDRRLALDPVDHFSQVLLEVSGVIH